MGIARGALNVLCAEGARRPLGGRILTLGRMDIHFGLDVLRSVAARHGVALQSVPEPPPAQRPYLAAKGYLSDQHVLRSIGFSEVRSLDVSDYEGADILFDLNEPDPPAELEGSCDVIFDGGTLEHVFHLPNALANIHRMLAPGGRVIHVAPSSNHIDHGFYMFSPTFFWDYYRSNGYSLETSQVFRHTPDHTAPWEVSNYEAGCLWKVAYGGLDDALYGVICVATKLPESTHDVVPTQSDCLDSWQRRPAELEAERALLAKAADAAGDLGDTAARTLHRAFGRLGKEVLGSLPLQEETRRRVERLRQSLAWEPPPPRKGLGLEVVARY